MKRYTSLLMAAMLILLSFFLPSCNESDNGFSIDLLKTGDSDCTIIKIGSHTLIIDAAEKDDYELIDTTLSKRNVTDVDLLVLTHYDNDHIGSAPDIIYNYDVKEVIVPDYVRDSSLVDLLNRTLRQKGIEPTVLSGGSDDLIRTFGDAVFTIDSPDKASYTDENDYSLITLMTFSDCNFLFLGDALSTRMSEYMPELLDSYYLVKMPHHGDYFSEIGTLIKEHTISFAIVNTETTDDAEIKLRQLIASSSPKGVYTCNGSVTVEYGDNGFSVWQ